MLGCVDCSTPTKKKCKTAWKLNKHCVHLAGNDGEKQSEDGLEPAKAWQARSHFSLLVTFGGRHSWTPSFKKAGASLQF